MPEVVELQKTAAPKGAIGQRKVRRRLGRRTLRIVRVIAALFWAFVFVKIFIADVDELILGTFAPSAAWILDYRSFAAALLVLVCVLASRNWAARQVLFQFAFFPFIAASWLLPAFLLRNWPFLIAFAPMIQSLVLNIRGFIVWYCLAFLAAVAVLFSTHDVVLVLGVGVLSVFLIRHYFLEFKKTFKPSSVFSDLAQVVQCSRSALVRAALPPGPVREMFTNRDAPRTEAEEKKYQYALQMAYIVQSCILVGAERFRDVARSRLLDLYFIVSLFFTLVLTIVCFSFVYLALYRVDPQSFEPAGLLRYWDFLGLSFCMITRAPLTSLSVSSGAATAIGYMQAIVGFVFAAIVINFLLASARARYKEDLDQVIEELKNGANEIASQLRDDYELTLEDIELMIIDKHFQLVNGLRKSRGLPALPVARSPIGDGAAAGR